MRLIYFGLLLLAFSGMLIAALRRAPGRTLQGLLIWALLFVALIAAHGLWPDLRRALLPRTALSVPSGIELRAADDGHFYADATINGTIGYGNRDMLMRVFAVQLTNPYNVAIQLGAHELDPDYERKSGDPTSMRDIDPGNAALHPGFDRMKDYYYLDFAGRTYALVQLQEQHDYAFTTNPTTPTDLLARPIVVPAGESVVVYATSTLPRDIMVNRVGWPGDASAQPTPCCLSHFGFSSLPRPCPLPPPMTS